MMNNTHLRNKRLARRQIIESIGCCSIHVVAANPKNETKDICKRCGKTKRIHSGGICSRCYDQEHSKGYCEGCHKRTVLRSGLCDACYRNKNYEGRCKICKKTKVLKKGICSTCYKKQNYKGICKDCGKEDYLTKSLCSRCWDHENRRGTCKRCSHEGPLKADLCSTCYKKENAQGKCKLCGNSGVLTDDMCKTCYDKEHYGGLCNSCGNFGVLIDKYCRTCHDSQDEMDSCKKCKNIGILDHNGVCKKCSKRDNDIGTCRVCSQERPLVFGNMCRQCYDDKAEGIQHYMKSTIKKLLVKLVGPKNFKKDPDEIFLKGENDPFCADFEIRDLTGGWCPAQYFNSRDEWTSKYNNVVDFSDFYKKYLKPKNYVMFTPGHGHPATLKEYLIDRGFLQPTGLPYGKKISVRKNQMPLSKRSPLEKGITEI